MDVAMRPADQGQLRPRANFMIGVTGGGVGGIYLARGGRRSADRGALWRSASWRGALIGAATTPADLEPFGQVWSSCRSWWPSTRDIGRGLGFGL